jgi:hypothetical protein
MMLLSLVSRQQAGVNNNSASAKSIQVFFFQKFEIILIVACHNYDGFYTSPSSCFHENSFHYFKDYLITKLTSGSILIVVCQFETLQMAWTFK